MRSLECGGRRERLSLPRGSELCEPSCSGPAAQWRAAVLRQQQQQQPAGCRREQRGPRRAAPATRGGAATASLFFQQRPMFNPSKLDVTFLPCARSWQWQQPLPSVAPTPAPAPAAGHSRGGQQQQQRRYTLTHNDVTGSLQLSVGANFNHAQLSNWYLRLLRDEVLAEWELGSGGAIAPPTLHVYCHVSGEEFWLATPRLRRFIFEKEMPLVLETIRYAERRLLREAPALREARVMVHFQSDVAALNEVADWGQLGDESSWPQQPPLLALWKPLLDYLLSRPAKA